jgi:hypothetical protein
MLPPNTTTIRKLSHEEGISEATLHKWRSDAARLSFRLTQDRQLGIQKKGTLADRARAEALVFRLAPQERDTWLGATAPTRNPTAMERSSSPINGVLSNSRPISETLRPSTITAPGALQAALRARHQEGCLMVKSSKLDLQFGLLVKICLN